MLRAIFWFKLARDGSLYLGPHYKNIGMAKTGDKKSRVGGLQINYDEGTVLDVKKFDNLAKISMHASGIVHSGGTKFFRGSLRDVQGQEQIAIIIMFQSNSDRIEVNKVLVERFA